MTDREALAAALVEHFSLRDLDEHDTVDAAATKYLAQLPEKCGRCDGTGWYVVPPGLDNARILCPSGCHNGRVYPAELVERIAGYAGIAHAAVIRVLDALNGEMK